MQSIFYTVYEKRYHLGVGSLVNSVFQNGFTGTTVLYYRDEPPSWLQLTDHPLGHSTSIGEREIICIPTDPDRHLGFQKAFAAIDIIEKFPDLEYLYYADPDVNFLADFAFFEKWASCGLGVAMDANYPHMPKSHPWRKMWESWLNKQGFEIKPYEPYYANSGAFCCKRPYFGIFSDWCEIILRYEKDGGDTSNLRHKKRGFDFIAGDQDALALAQMITDVPISFMGMEAMGFTGQYFLISHAVNTPKPWDCNFILSALRGVKPSVEATKWLDYCEQPIPVLSKNQIRMKRFTLLMAKCISRIWKR